MSIKEISNSILEFLKVFISWPFLTFLIIFILRKEIKKVLENLTNRLRKAPGGWEFDELHEVKEEVSKLVNNAEIENEKNIIDPKIDPYSIRLKHRSEKLNEKYWNVSVWLDAPESFLDNVKRVVYERHPTFRTRFFESNQKPFKDSFKCWGEFTIKAQIYLNDGQILKRQRYLVLDENGNDINRD